MIDTTLLAPTASVAMAPGAHRFLYAAAIALSCVGIALGDRRWRLALWFDRRATLVAVMATVLYLLLWDVAGISLGIFFMGQGPWQSGVVLAPELPIEELLFLIFLSYLTIIIYAATRRYLVLSRQLAASKAIGATWALIIIGILVSSTPNRSTQSLTYAAVNGSFLLPIIWGFARRRRAIATSQRWRDAEPMIVTWATLTVLLGLTAIVDPCLIAAGIVDYTWQLTSGIRIAGAPVEDGAYAVASALLAPPIFDRLSARRATIYRNNR